MKTLTQRMRIISCVIFGHNLAHGTHGRCLNGCGWTFCRPSGIITDHQEFHKALKSISR
jgi:hypothetical protein